MIQILVVTLGKHGESLIEATEHIIGHSDHVHYLTVDWHENLDVLKQRLQEKLSSLKMDNGVLLLTDVFGSTATNICLERAQPGKIDVVTGVNLPMIIKASTLEDQATLRQAADTLRNQGRKAISIAGEML